MRAHNQGRPRRALRLLDRCLAAVGEPTSDAQRRIAAAAWITRSLVESELGAGDRGAAALDTAGRHVAVLDDAGLRVRIHLQRAMIAGRAGRLDDALAHFEAAAPEMTHVEPSDRFVILLNTGNIRMFRGELRPARRSLARAIELARAEGMVDRVFKASHNLGYLEFLAGDLPSALRLMDEAGALETKVSRGVWLLDRARILSESGLFREADVALSDAAAIFRRDRLHQDLAETELERARCALLVGDAASARHLAAAARGRFRRRNNDRGRRAAELVWLQARLHTGLGTARLVDAVAALRAELDAAALGEPAYESAVLLAEAQLAAGEVTAAAATIGGAVPRKASVRSRLHAHDVHARLALAQGRPAEAVRRVRRGLHELAGYQASFGSIDLRTAAAVHGRRLAEFGVALALDVGRPAAVFAAAEQARATSSRLPPVRPPDDPVVAELLAELRQTVESLRAAEQDKAASEPLLRRRRELESRIAARSWTVSGSGAATRPASLDAVRAGLTARGRTMVTYIQAAGRLAVVLVGPRLRLVDLGPAAPVIEQVRRVRADLDVLARDRLPGGIRAAVRGSLDHSLAALDAALLSPLAVDGPLVVVSTGVLGQLPWSSLPSRRAASIVVAPSATKWLSSLGGAGHAGGVFAFAGPDLPRAADEAAAVARAWPATVTRTGADATSAEFAAAVGRAGVLHVAAHGIHQPENPLFSALRLADGPVFAHELHAPAPEHVVLSACEVGLATIRPGDEALGLASALLALGTRSVIAGVARVGDAAAADTMAAYHARLAAGADSADALAAALVEVAEDVVPPFVTFGSAWRRG